MVIPCESQEGSEAHAAPSGLMCSLLNNFLLPYKKVLHTAILSFFRSTYLFVSFCFLRGIEVRSSQIYSGSSCNLVFAHQFSLISHVYFHVSFVSMTVLCPVVTFTDALFLSPPHIPAVAEGLGMAAGGWLLRASFPSSTEIVSRHSGRWELPLTSHCQERSSGLGIIRSRFCRIVLKGQLGKNPLFSLRIRINTLWFCSQLNWW